MSLLTIVQNAAMAIGLPSPTSVAGNVDQSTQTLKSFADREGVELSRRYQWEALVLEATHTTLAAENQGVLTTIASGIDYIIQGTMYDRTLQREVRPYEGPQAWQFDQARTSTGPYYRYRVRGGSLLFYPAPTAGNTVAFEYKSRNFCASSGGTGQASWAADDDVGVLDEEIMTLGVIWRFLQAKGVDYGEAYRAYESQVQQAMSRDGGKSVMSMTGARATNGVRGVIAPDGSWNL